MVHAPDTLYRAEWGLAAMTLAEQYRFREEVVKRLDRDLVGPWGSTDETIDEAPITRYLAGILYPQYGTKLSDIEATEDPDDYDENSLPDPPVAMANRHYPSSMGMTFTVDSDSGDLTISIEAARYEEVPVDNDEKVRWARIPLKLDPVSIDASVPRAGDRMDLSDGLQLFCRVREPDQDGAVSITLALINANTAVSTERDASAFFQPSVSVRAANDAPAFVERKRSANPRLADDDLRSYRLLYRHAKTFGAGHGCSVDWDIDPGNKDRAQRVWTTFVPEFELPMIASNPQIESPALAMLFLADADRGEVLRDLRELCQRYDEWTNLQAEAGDTLEGEFKQTAEEHVAACREALRRVRSGIDLLASDEDAWRAFRLANRAMLNTRARTVWLKNSKPAGGPSLSDEHRWYPFQLMFLLLCLEGVADPSVPDRELVDLLWFPTGGGKTEAYLGLIAFTAFLRRPRHRGDGGGVTVLMRYTLRLLTIQQFDRAALLICSCELLRRNEPDLRGTPQISIGLWVGQGATPNILSQARIALDKLRRGVDLEGGDPVQLHHCPWCGVVLNHQNYYIRDKGRRLVITCGQKDCEFRDDLPAYVVDEDIYAQRPTLIVGTADKFAALPWNERVAQLFNLDGPEPPPELIVQDELHLISGPLGTLAGLYETAIEVLCSGDGIHPKVVASTATIRRASQQTLGLFAREVRQFPPPGIDARDSYFAVEVSREARGTRIYVGLMGGSSQTTLMIRAYASLLDSAAVVPGDDATRDPYWTLVGYFSSLRILGGARLRVQDDVRDRLLNLSDGTDRTPRELSPIELTSRVPSGLIPEYLSAMAVSHPDPSALDVILATNMISVGMDIDRLGLMAVMGQPQSTSEYIQATSRVGRQHPGLVVVLLNEARSRDRSHYESFIGFHSALYREVESTSVTPFSSRARDRALHAVIVALARQTIPGMRANEEARSVDGLHERLAPVKASLLQRVAAVAPHELEATAIAFDDFVNEWIDKAEEHEQFFYSMPSDPERSLLGDAAELERDEPGNFPTLRSLRDVDKASGLFLVR